MEDLSEFDPDKLKKAYEYVSNIFKILNGETASDEGKTEFRARTINRPKNPPFYGAMQTINKVNENYVANNIPNDFNQLVVTSKDKHLSHFFQYKGFAIEKHGEYDMFYLQSINNVLCRYDINCGQVRNFIHSYGFYLYISLLDPSLPKYGNVYLLINTENKTCKIGMSYDINKRYSKEKRENELVYLFPVKDMKKSENKLIKGFQQKYGKPVRGKETFEFANEKDVKKTFMNIINKDVIDIDIHGSMNNHFRKFKTSYGREGLWVSFDVASIIFNHFISDETDRKDVMQFMSLIKYMISEDEYIYMTYNQKLKTNVEFILFHKYRIMRNEKDLYVNASALYNSIKKHGECKVPYRKISEVLKSPRFQFRIEQLKIARPKDVPYYFHENSEQKYLEGYYIHYALVHFLIDLIDAKYAIETSILIFDIYSGNMKLNTSKEKKKTIDIKQLYPNIQDEIKIPTLHGGNKDSDIHSIIFQRIFISLIIVGLIILILSFHSHASFKHEKINDKTLR